MGTDDRSSSNYTKVIINSTFYQFNLLPSWGRLSPDTSVKGSRLLLMIYLKKRKRKMQAEKIILQALVLRMNSVAPVMCFPAAGKQIPDRQREHHSPISSLARKWQGRRIICQAARELVLSLHVTSSSSNLLQLPSRVSENEDTTPLADTLPPRCGIYSMFSFGRNISRFTSDYLILGLLTQVSGTNFSNRCGLIFFKKNIQQVELHVRRDSSSSLNVHILDSSCVYP